MPDGSGGDLGQYRSTASSDAAAARRALARVQDHARGGGCRFHAELDDDAQVRVSGQHDTGMTQLVGDRLEFVAFQRHQRGSAPFLPAAMSAPDDDRLWVQGDRAAVGFRFQRARPQLAVDTLPELPRPCPARWR